MIPDPKTGYEILASGEIEDVARAFKPHNVTVHPADVPEMPTCDPDAYECGRDTRRIARQMVQAIVTCRFNHSRDRNHLALFDRLEAEASRRVLHRRLRAWAGNRSFAKGYRAEGMT